MNRKLRQGIVKAALALICAVTLQAAGASQQPSVRFVLADGAHVSDVTTVVAIPTASSGAYVDKVAFSVDGAVRYTDTSTPYSYDWDTLQETEGPHTLSATVTDSAGRTASAQIRVIVDNELSKGAAFFASGAMEALEQGDNVKARNYMRRALKLDPKNLVAAQVKARLLQADGNIDGAIAALEAAAIPDSDYDALTELWQLHMADTSPDIDLASFLQHAATAVDLYHKAAAARIASLKGDDPGVAVRRGDVRLADRQWSAAIHDYEQAADIDHATGSVANRILLADTLSGARLQAVKLLRDLNDQSRADEVTPVLAAMNMVDLSRFEQARQTVRALVAAGNLPALIVEAYADIGLNDSAAAHDALRRAMDIAPDNPDVLLLRGHFVRGAQDPRDALIRAMRANPTTPQPYVVYAFLDMMRTGPGDPYPRAERMLRFALKIAPNNGLASVGLALCRLGAKDGAGAAAALKRLRNPTGDADVETVYAQACELLNDDLAARAALRQAAHLAPDDWAGMAIPPLPNLVAHVFRYRLSPVLTPATLYTARTAK